MNMVWNKLKSLPKREKVFWLVLVVLFVVSIIWVNNNYRFYERTIAKIITVEEIDVRDVTDTHGNRDKLHIDKLTAKIMNGDHQGETIELMNEYSVAKAYDFNYTTSDAVFISVRGHQDDILSGAIIDMKRDKNIVYVAWLFTFVLILVGKSQGLFSVISLFVNALILSFALDLQMNALHINLMWVSAICALLFTIVSLFLVNGFNDKTYAAIVATILGTTASLVLTYVILQVTGERGLRYEEMEYLTRTYQLVFMASLFIGSLGAVMDIGITMASSMFGMYEENPKITTKRLKESGQEIGKDIMGAMTNILFFAYISGAIPVLILYLKNGAPLGFTLQMNLTLELARALAGGIGIVLSIPIALYTSLYFVKRKKANT